MKTDKFLIYLGTLVLGIILSYFLINPLAAFVYLLIWIDVLVIARIEFAEMAGIETLTLAAVISGIAFGPVIGFFFSLFGISLVAILLVYLVKKSLTERLPNIYFIGMASAAALSGILITHIPLLAVVAIAVIFKHVVYYAINIGIANIGIEHPWDILSLIINVAFSVIFVSVIQQMGLLSYFV